MNNETIILKCMETLRNVLYRTRKHIPCFHDLCVTKSNEIDIYYLHCKTKQRMKAIYRDQFSIEDIKAHPKGTIFVTETWTKTMLQKIDSLLDKYEFFRLDELYVNPCHFNISYRLIRASEDDYINLQKEFLNQYPREYFPLVLKSDIIVKLLGGKPGDLIETRRKDTYLYWRLIV